MIRRYLLRLLRSDNKPSVAFPIRMLRQYVFRQSYTLTLFLAHAHQAATDDVPVAVP